MRAVRRGIDNLEELKHIKAAKAKAKQTCFTSKVQVIIIKEFIIAILDSLFNDFNQSSINIGNIIIDQFSFLIKRADIKIIISGKGSNGSFNKS